MLINDTLPAGYCAEGPHLHHADIAAEPRR
jgi:hypothetical protein